VANREAVDLTIRTALALNCEIPEHSKFDRKNYFYPDLPKGYQISQYDLPLSLKGHLDIEVEGQPRRVGITRVHLEEDTGKLIHSGDIHTSTSSLVNLNRCGVPLMEIVSEPDMRSAAEAREYMQRLRQVLVWIGVNDGNLEEGSLRCDANVSVRPAGQQELGVKVEVKNMNSFRAVFMALEHEIERQRLALLNGETIVQETRGWNEARGITVGQRSKEFAHDYRYFPEPDLPPLSISRGRVDEVGLSEYDAAQLTATKELAAYYEEAIKATGKDHAKEVANWVVGDVNRALKDGEGLAALNIRPGGVAALVQRKLDGTVSNNQARELFVELVTAGEPVEDAGPVDRMIEARGMRQVTDTSQLEAWVEAAIAAQPQAAEDFRSGNDRAVGRLVGAVMQASGGKANGPAVSAMLHQKLRG
jgi:aspartyl-tRNA(Asn)/glutamyl-tRNA(Gln) amidotransferase subunit B